MSDKEKGSYSKYLQTDHWKALRVKAAKMWGSRCMICKGGASIQYHHTVYRGDWTNTLPEDLRPLCDSCHGKHHAEVPIETHSPEQEWSDVTPAVVSELQTVQNNRRQRYGEFWKLMQNSARFAG